MSKVYMTIGLPCTKKSLNARNFKEEYGDSVVILDSDEIRKELFGAEIQTFNDMVFDVMNKRTIMALREGKDVVYCATNLNRKRRIHFIQNICKGYEVDALFFPISLGECLERNIQRRYVRDIPLSKIEQMFRNIDVPLYLEGFNTIMIFHTTPPKEFNKYTLPFDIALYHYDQNNPYHNETLGNHIISTARYIINNLKDKLTEKENDILQKVAYFHDLGKPYVRIQDDNGVSHYYGHEKVSAYLYSLYVKGGIVDKETDVIFTLISYHDGLYKYKDNIDNLIKIIGIENYRLLLLFNEADKYRPNISE